MNKIYIAVVVFLVLSGIKSDENELKFDVEQDVSIEAADIDIKYKKKGSDDEFYKMDGTTTLLNCDIGDENYHCKFTVHNLTESEFEIRVEPVPLSQISHIQGVYNIIHLPNSISAAWLYLKTSDYNKLKNEKSVSDQAKNTPIWKMLVHNAPEHLCPQRVALTEYSKGKERTRDHILVVPQEIEEYKAIGYVENGRGLLGYCSPAMGECGATKQLYRRAGELGTGKNKQKKPKPKKPATSYGIDMEGKEGWEPVPYCYVWV